MVEESFQDGCNLIVKGLLLTGRFPFLKYAVPLDLSCPHYGTGLICRNPQCANVIYFAEETFKRGYSVTATNGILIGFIPSLAVAGANILTVLGLHRRLFRPAAGQVS